MFHGLYEHRDEPFNDNLLPHQPFTVDDLDRLIGRFKQLGYRCVGPDDLLQGLDPNSRYVLITFDDGYANNLRALPVLQAHDAPATFFVSTGPVAAGKSYWWDAHYRARRRDGAGHDEIVTEQEELKQLPFHEIEATLTKRYGEAVFTPVDDTDRPMTEAELKAFAADPRVSIGNHTVDHAILTACSPAERDAQIKDCQDYLTALLGKAPSIIAYPNGNYDADVIAAARAVGLRLGVTVVPRKNRLPVDAEGTMLIGRYCIDGGPDLDWQCLRCRSEVQLRYARQRAHMAA
jgi:peptidoglycan/xylan/chitin deacetylase (PgdA/CDA1 family)